MSGDFFFIRTLKDKTYIALGDVAGHGIQAALYGTSIYTIINTYFNTTQDSFISLSGILAYIMHNMTIFGFQNEDTVHFLMLEINHKNNKIKQISMGQAGEPAFVIDKKKKEIMGL